MKKRVANRSNQNDIIICGSSSIGCDDVFRLPSIHRGFEMAPPYFSLHKRQYIYINFNHFGILFIFAFASQNRSPIRCTAEPRAQKIYWARPQVCVCVWICCFCFSPPIYWRLEPQLRAHTLPIQLNVHNTQAIGDRMQANERNRNRKRRRKHSNWFVNHFFYKSLRATHLNSFMAFNRRHECKTTPYNRRQLDACTVCEIVSDRWIEVAMNTGERARGSVNSATIAIERSKRTTNAHTASEWARASRMHVESAQHQRCTVHSI